MDKVVIYIHGKGGNKEEANRYKPLFEGYDVKGIEYKSYTPWHAKEEFPLLFDEACLGYDSVILVANSIGAYFAINALYDKRIEKAYFISPIVDMERLITDMMKWANVSEDDLYKQKEIHTDFGETLSYEYLCYVREHPIQWMIPTHILYGEKDNLTSYETIYSFVNKINATLTVMEEGEHWFHTQKQMAFLDNWIKERR